VKLASLALAVLFALPAQARRSPTYERAVKLFWQGRVEEAAALYQKALERDPVNAALLTDLGLALDRLGRADEAERHFRRAIEKDPLRWLAYANLADLVSALDSRWERREQIDALLAGALAKMPPKAHVARVGLTFALARFERSVGRTREALQRLDSLADDELTPMERDRKLKLADAIAADERARAVEDWPEPQVAEADQRALAEAERLLGAGLFAAALRAAEALASGHPGWHEPRWARARALHALRSVDEAARELSVLVRLRPSHAQGWKLLGQILEEHGGQLEAERADEALRQALALEPSWTDLWRLRAKVALRRGRGADALRFLERLRLDPDAAHAEELRTLAAQARARLAESGPRGAPQRPAAEPAPEARELLRRAQEFIAKPERTDDEQASELLQQALSASPAFVEAAATLYSLTEAVPETTVQALWDDGPALLELAAQIQRIRARAPIVRPWIDRAVALGTTEALLARAQLRAASGERSGALDDLLAYVAGPQPSRLDDARQLRAALTPPPRADAVRVRAQLKLAEDHPAEALAELHIRCDKPPRRADPARLIALGRVHEYVGDLPAALACYRAAIDSPEALQRLVRVAARAPARDLDGFEAQLEAASAAGMAEADWPLARRLLAQGRGDEALVRIERFLRDGAVDHPARAAALAARDGMLDARDARTRAARRRALLSLAALALLGLGAALVLWHGSSVAGALRGRPALFPAVARAVAEIRHDVLKHRASVLGAAVDRPEALADVARSLLSPEPASRTVAGIYERLRHAARAQGVTLRRLGREPIFGPLARDLMRAESWLRRKAPGARYAVIDARLREVHSERLGALLKLGPRTLLDAAALSSWIRDVEAEVRRGGASWVSPALQLPGMEVEFPVERGALALIFANLLRNAQDAAGAGSVLVRLAEERDAAGRRMVALLVGDSSARGLTLEAIESRESGRGLAIVRDLTREWNGHLIVRPEAAPWTKAVGACFPAPVASA